MNTFSIAPVVLIVGVVLAVGFFGAVALVVWLLTRTPAAPPPASPSRPGSLEDEARQLLASGRKIEAIKVWREKTGLGLKEAKDAVEAIERGEPAPPPQKEVVATSTGDLRADVLALVRADQLIAAIKLYRERTGLGLKEAKDAVEAIRDGKA